MRDHLALTARVTALIAALLAAGAGPALAQAAQPPLEDVEGTLDVIYEDAESGSRLLHFLDTGDRRLPLRFRGNPPDLPSGTRVRVRGNLADGDVSVEVVDSLSVPITRTTGVQRVLVILMNFSNDTRQPYTAAHADSVNAQVRDYFTENAYGQVSMQFTVTGWHTVAATNTSCDYSTFATQGDAAATAAGFTLSNFERRLYAFPQTSACSWWGLGNLSGPRSWVNGSYALRVVAHELGHNFGDHHSMSLRCDAAGCTESEYGDDRDVMGAASGHLNVFQKERLGWLNYGVSPPIHTVTTSNTYWLEPVSTLNTGTAKGLKIWNPNTNMHYYVETRARIGFDSSVPAGVTLHTGSPTVARSSRQLDMAPLTSTWTSTLAPGQTFSDASLGLYITTLTADASGALVQVDFGGLPCTVAAPRLTVTSSASSPVAPGTPVTYTLAVTNTDSSGCGSSLFSLAASVPSGWSAALSTPSLAVAPGSTASATVTVTSPQTATTGTYALQMRAYEPGVAVHDAIVSASYAVAATDIAPGAPTNMAASVSGSTVTLSWQPPSSGGGVASYLLDVGTSPGASDVTNSRNVGNVLRVSGELPRGTYYARVRATNAAGTSAASNEVRINVSRRLRTPGTITVTWTGTTATLAWTAPATSGPDETPTGYVLEAGTTPGASDVARLHVGNRTVFRAEIPAGTYYVRVRAVNALGDSDPTEEVVLRAPGAPDAPTALTVTGEGATVNLQWNAPTTGPAPTGYIVEAGSAPGLSNLATLRVSDVTRFVTTAPPGTYYVRVRSVNARGTSAPSNEIVVQR